jgi:hypothetical protein
VAADPIGRLEDRDVIAALGRGKRCLQPDRAGPQDGDARQWTSLS